MASHKSILDKSKNFIKNGIIKNKNVSYNLNYFLSSWAESIGYLNLKNFSKKKVNYFLKFLIIFKEFYTLNKSYLENTDIKSNKKYKKIIFSYFVSKNLKKNGSYFDKYFSYNTDLNKEILWILIPLTNNNKNYKTKNNVIILKRKSFNFFKNFITSIYFYIKNLFLSYFFTNNINLKFIEPIFFKNLFEIINLQLLKHNIKKLYFPYEAQPHQHYLVSKLKKTKIKLKIIGYMHTVLPPLPVDYIKRPGHPDLVYVNGKQQKKIMCNKLGWNANEVKNITSFRYKKNQPMLSNRIFLPYFIEDENKIFNLIKNLILTRPKNFFPKFLIRNHPSMSASRRHKSLIKKIRFFLNSNKKLFKNKPSNKKISIFIGSTAAAAEGLERGLRVFHICVDPFFEKLNSFYWDKILSINLNENIFEYKLIDKGSIIKFGNSKNKSIS
jgi:hypothetical protein